MNSGALWQVQVEHSQAFHIGHRPRRKEEFNRFSPACNHEIDFETIEVALLAGDIATKRLVLINFGSSNADVIAYRYRETVNEVGFPDLWPSKARPETPNLIRPHKSLRLRVEDDPQQKWMPRPRNGRRVDRSYMNC